MKITELDEFLEKCGGCIDIDLMTGDINSFNYKEDLEEENMLIEKIAMGILEEIDKDILENKTK